MNRAGEDSGELRGTGDMRTDCRPMTGDYLSRQLQPPVGEISGPDKFRNNLFHYCRGTTSSGFSSESRTPVPTNCSHWLQLWRHGRAYLCSSVLHEFPVYCWEAVQADPRGRKGLSLDEAVNGNKRGEEAEVTAGVLAILRRRDSSIVQRVVAQIPCFLPDGLKGSLPTTEEIEAQLTREGRQK